MSDETFDVVILGGGPAGEHALGRVRRAGLTVALVEEELVGGECSYWACMPSKTLLRPGAVIAAARRVPGAAEAVSGSIDATTALQRRDWMVSDWHDAGQVAWVSEAGGVVVRGHGRLIGERRVAIDGPDGPRVLVARRAVILATGSKPVPPPIAGLDRTRHWDSRGATSAHEVPRRLAVIGGGVVGVELAQAWRRLGAEEVTVLEPGARLLSRLEPFAGELLASAFEAEGIDVRLGTRVVEVARASDDDPVELAIDQGASLVADELLVATGRAPRSDSLGLESVGLVPGAPVEVDPSMRVRGLEGDWLYAVGDVSGGALLTHMGKYEARIAVATILGEEIVAEGRRAVPSVVFTDPQIASVGLTASEARARGLDVTTASVDLAAVSAAAIVGDGTTGRCQIVLDSTARTIVGATFVGPEVADLLHAATVAIVGELPIDRLRHAVAAFPTLSEVWLELVDEALRAH